MIIFILILIVASVIFSISSYNALVRLNNRIQNAWAQIDVQLERRHDLIPNLVETTKGYIKHERETLEKVIEARSKAMQARSVSEKSEAELALDDAISKFFLVVERYPDLKANENFLRLHEEIVSTENKIAFSRQNYNDQVMFFNNRTEVFPSNMIAAMFNFKEKEYFEIDDIKKETPSVNF